jgi:hypothetical protein
MTARSDEGTDRTKVEAGRDSRATYLASRCDFWFHGPKSFVEKRFAENYNSCLAPVNKDLSFSYERRRTEMQRLLRLRLLCGIQVPG